VQEKEREHRSLTVTPEGNRSFRRQRFQHPEDPKLHRTDSTAPRGYRFVTGRRDPPQVSSRMVQEASCRVPDRRTKQGSTIHSWILCRLVSQPLLPSPRL
jgi:hypothetical protein